MSDTERRRAIQAGLGRVRPAGRVESIPSGILSLDWALGVGGFPRGRIVELFGSEACGKTTIALEAVAEAQRGGGTAAWIDADHSLDAAYARAVGVDLERLPLAQPASGEEALEIAVRLAASRAVDLLVLDSVAALVPRLELEAGPADAFAGLQHHLIERELRRMAGAARRSGCVLLLVNQIRNRLGVAVGDPETTAGGYALRAQATARAEVRTLAVLEGGIRVRLRLVKNKLAPLRETAFEIRYGRGVARLADLAACAARCGIGVDARVLAADPEARRALETAVRRALDLQMPD